MLIFSVIPLVLCLLVFVLAVYLGFRLLRRGWCARIGLQPHCRRCDYLLVQLAADRCPECGAPINPSNTVYGEARRSGALIAVGLLAWTVSLALAYVIASDSLRLVSGINWYQFHSTARVLQDLRTGSGRPPPAVNALSSELQFSHGFPWERIDLARVALDELLRRERSGNLPAQDRDAIVEMALAVQQSWPNLTPVQYHLLNYLNDRVAAGDLGADHLARLFRPALDLNLAVRPIVNSGDAVPVRFAMKQQWAVLGNWLIARTYQSVTTDGQKVTLSPIYSTQQQYSWFPVPGDEPDEYTLQCSDRGQHLLSATVLLEIKFGHNGEARLGPVVRTATVQLVAPFKVVENSPRHAIKLVNDSAMGSIIKASVRGINLAYASRRDPPCIFGAVMAGPVPVNIAFDVFARYGGHDYLVAHLTGSAGNAHPCFEWCRDQPSMPKPPPTIDLVLRSSSTAALMTLDLYQIWNGEVVLSGLPITDVR